MEGRSLTEDCNGIVVLAGWAGLLGMFMYLDVACFPPRRVRAACHKAIRVLETEMLIDQIGKVVNLYCGDRIEWCEVGVAEETAVEEQPALILVDWGV